MTTRISRFLRVFSAGPSIDSAVDRSHASVVEPLESRQLLSSSIHAPLVRHERAERPEAHQPLHHEHSTTSSDKSTDKTADKSTDKGSDTKDKSPDSGSHTSTDSPDKSTDSSRDA